MVIHHYSFTNYFVLKVEKLLGQPNSPCYLSNYKGEVVHFVMMKYVFSSRRCRQSGQNRRKTYGHCKTRTHGHAFEVGLIYSEF